LLLLLFFAVVRFEILTGFAEVHGRA